MAEREEARRKRDRQKAAQLRYYYCYGAGAMYKKLEFAKKSKPEGEKKKDPAAKKGGGDEKDAKKQDDKKDEKKDAASKQAIWPTATYGNALSWVKPLRGIL